MSRDGVVEFLYLLARDELPLGVVERLVAHVEELPDVDRVFSEPYLASWANVTAGRLRNVGRPDVVEVDTRVDL